jgi:hypothetical protein
VYVLTLSLHQGVGASTTLALTTQAKLVGAFISSDAPLQTEWHGCHIVPLEHSCPPAVLHQLTSRPTPQLFENTCQRTEGSLGHAWQRAGRVPFGRSYRLLPHAPMRRPPGAPVGLQTCEKSASPPLFSADSVSYHRQRHVLPDVPAQALSSAFFEVDFKAEVLSLLCSWHMLESARHPSLSEVLRGGAVFQASCKNELRSVRGCQSLLCKQSCRGGEVRDCS